MINLKNPLKIELGDTDHPEPYAVVLVVRVVVVTVTNLQVVGIVVPATAPFNPVRAA